MIQRSKARRPQDWYPKTPKNMLLVKMASRRRQPPVFLQRTPCFKSCIGTGIKHTGDSRRRLAIQFLATWNLTPAR